MSSVGKKLTLNFSRSRLKKKENLQEPSNLGHRSGSWGTLHPHGSKGDKTSSTSNLAVGGGDILSHSDILELTQFVRNFTDALYKLKDIFSGDDLSGTVVADDAKVQAHEKLGELLCQLSSMKKYPSVLTSDVLMAAHHVITKVKLCNYEDLANEGADVLDYIDKLALSFSTSVSEYLMGGMDMDSSIGRSRSCENLDVVQPDDIYEAQEKRTNAAIALQTAEIDQVLLRFDSAVDMALNRAKAWSKYAKDIAYYVDKRANMEAEFAKNLAKLANGVQQTISEDSFLPFQSIFCTALGQDVDYASKCQATYHLIQAKKFVEPLNARRVEHDKIKKSLKDLWSKETRKMHDAVSNLKKTRAMYVSRHQEYEKAKETTQKAENEITTQSSGLAKMEKKKRLEDDAMQKAMDAEAAYKHCVVVVNNCQQDLEHVKADILAQTRDLLFHSDRILKTATVGYFQLLQSAIAPVPAQYEELCDISERYEPGCQYAEYVKHLPPPTTLYAPHQHSFEPYSPDTKGYELRKPSTQSSGSGSDIQTYGDESPISASHKLKVGHGDDSDSASASSSRSTSPSTSPYPQKRSHHSHGSAVSNEQQVTFRGVLLSHSARSHVFRNLRAPTRCRHCDSYVYFQGAECEKCGIASHKRCLETLTYECGRKEPVPQLRRMTTFGVDFCAHVKENHTSVPHIVQKCTAEIENHALDIKGIYRVSGVKSKVENLCQSFENDRENVDLSEQNPHVISNVLKLYLRQLPEPLLTFRLYPLLVQLAKEDAAGTITNDEVRARLLEHIHSLPPAVICTLSHLMHHLARVVQHEQYNHMSASNLGIVFGPTLLRPNDGGSSLNSLIETPHQTHIIEELILHVDEIFGTEEKSTKSEQCNTLQPGGSSGEATTPVSASSDGWPGSSDITGNLLAELQRDPQFMQVSSTAPPFAGAAAAHNPTVDKGETDGSEKLNVGVQGAQVQPQDPANSTSDKEQITAENTQHSTIVESQHNENTIESTTDLNRKEVDINERKIHMGSDSIDSENIESDENEGSDDTADVDSNKHGEDMGSSHGVVQSPGPRPSVWKAYSSSLHANQLSPGLNIELDTPVESAARSPGLKKRILPSQLRKTEQKTKLSPQLLQPRPYSFRINKPANNPQLIVSAPPSSQTQDDFYLNSSSLIQNTGGIQLSNSAASTSSLMKQLRSLNKMNSAFYSASNSPVVTPKASARTSPKGTPKPSPRASPMLPRRTSSPLTLTSERQPEFV